MKYRINYEIAYIEFENDRYRLYTPINKNQRTYLHTVKETLEEIFEFGLKEFTEIEYDGRVYTDRILKLKKIRKRYNHDN